MSAGEQAGSCEGLQEGSELLQAVLEKASEEKVADKVLGKSSRTRCCKSLGKRV